MANTKTDPVLGRTYQIPLSALDDFEEYVAVLKKYARKKGLPDVDRSVVVTKLFRALKAQKKTPELFFQ